MKKIFFSTVLTFLILLPGIHASGSGNTDSSLQEWKAGVASVVITPRESIWMAGYASRDHPSEGVLHDLYAKALALEDAEGNRAVLITSDLIGFRGKYMPERIRTRLKSQYGLSDSQVILSYSHTHSGPELMCAPEEYPGRKDTTGPYSPVQREIIFNYSRMLEDKIVKLTGEALNSMVAVKICSGQGVSRFAVNRRINRERTKVNELVLELDGPVDHSVPVIKVEKASGQLLAVVFGYACHNTTLSIYEISGDYAGFSQTELEKTYPGATAMFFAGCGADQNPLPRRTVSYAIQYGKTLAAAVEAVLSEPMKELSPLIETKYSEIELGFSDPPPTRNDLLQALPKLAATSYPGPGKAENLLYRLGQGEKLKSSYNYPVQFWRLGEQKLVVLASEVVVDYSVRLKEILGSDTFIMAYANEGMGYIPSARVLREGDYEAEISPNFSGTWAADIEMKIISGVIELAAKTAE